MKLDKDKLHPADSRFGVVLTQSVWEQDAAMCTQEVCEPQALKSLAYHTFAALKGFVYLWGFWRKGEIETAILCSAAGQPLAEL